MQQIIYFPWEECLKITHQLPYYNSPQDKIYGLISWAEIPFWKLPYSIYLILIFWVGCDEKDYPAQIAPLCGELHLLSYQDSYITLGSIFT